MSDTPTTSPLTAEQVARLREKILSTMRKRHTLDHSLAWGLLLLGGAVILFAGLIVSFLLAFISFNIGFGFGIRGWFVVYLLALVPFLMWQERRTRGGFFTLAGTDIDLTKDADSTGEYLLQRTQKHAIAFAELLMWGPRAFLAGFRSLRGIRETGLDIVLPEAADVLTLMMGVEGGVPIAALVPTGTEPSYLMPVLKWMDEHDYIGISSRGDRVWVSSMAKKWFAADHGELVPKAEHRVVMNNPTPPSEPLV